jgi:DNA-binding NtrC family response regulator
MEFSMKPMLLIADNDPELREIYQRFLFRHGYVVETAADGLECVEKLRWLMPEVLVLGLELQCGGGDGVLAWLREQPGLARASVVLTATAACPADAFGLVRPPVVTFLPKPFKLTALLESVRDALAESQRDERYYLNRSSACPELHIG